MVDYVQIFLMGWFSFIRSQFLIPEEQSPIEEIFEFDIYYEYVFTNQALDWNLAVAICHYEYYGTLATLETDELKEFAIDAMSESNMELDGLWLGLEKKNGVFTWLDVNETVPEEEFSKCGNNSNVSYNSSTNELNCGALVRANHSQLCLISLSCQASRGFICKRPRGGNSPTTHQGWIRLRHRLYKIFASHLTYADAAKACIHFDNQSRLAVVETYEEAQLLGRYLLVGRPSLENVWIGAKWDEDFTQYIFEHEPIILANKTNRDLTYPPWRRNAMSKPFGCLLLDRHLSNITYFVESACFRLHCYMCYKMVEDDDPVDVCDVGDYDWRIYYNKSKWIDATDICRKSAHSGRLSVLEKKDLKYFIHIMESSKRYLLHVWLGAFLYGSNWVWTYTNSIVPKVEENGYPPWVVNRSYEDSVEKRNLCLNIDRENTLKAMYYGTDCTFPQAFICQYDKGTICLNVTTKITKETSTTPIIPTTTPTPRTTTTKTTLKTTSPTTTVKTTSKTTPRTPTTRTTPTTIKTTTTTPKTTTTPTTKTTATTTTRRTTTRRTTTRRTTTRRTTTRRTTTRRTTTRRSTTRRTTTRRTTTRRTTRTTKRTKSTTRTKRTTRSTTKRKTTTTKSKRTTKPITTEGPVIVSTTIDWMNGFKKRVGPPRHKSSTELTTTPL